MLRNIVYVGILVPVLTFNLAWQFEVFTKREAECKHEFFQARKFIRKLKNEARNLVDLVKESRIKEARIRYWQMKDVERECLKQVENYLACCMADDNNCALLTNELNQAEAENFDDEMKKLTSKSLAEYFEDD